MEGWISGRRGAQKKRKEKEKDQCVSRLDGRKQVNALPGSNVSECLAHMRLSLARKIHHRTNYRCTEFEVDQPLYIIYKSIGALLVLVLFDVRKNRN